MNSVAYPKKLTIALTDRCNLKCFICWRDEFEESIGSKGRHIDLKDIHHMDNAIRHAEAISITGFGESFLFPQLHEVLDYIFALNPRDNLIEAISNGTALSYDHARKIGSRLRELVVSLNASNAAAYQRDMHPEANQKDYTGKADPRVRLETLNGAGLTQFDRTCNRVREFLRGLEPSDRKKVRLHYVVHRDNIDDMDEFVLVARDLGCSTVGFYHYMVTQESRIDYSIYFHKERYNENFERAKRLGLQLGVKVDGTTFGSQPASTFNKERDCTSPFDEAIVYTTGEVAPCCHSGDEMMGNAFRGGFDDIWFGQKYRMLREERNLDACQTCNRYRTIDDIDLHFHPHVKTSARYKAIAASLVYEQKRNPLKLLVVGTGADGSRSLWSLISDLYAANGVEATVHYDANSYSTAHAVMAYVGRGDDGLAKKTLAAWRHDVVVGNNLAFLMPVIKQVFGPDLKIIHLKRSRPEAIRALVGNTKHFPQYWGGYAPLDQHHDIIRPTARHFHELDIGAWNALGLEGQLGWFYDKSHAMIAAEVENPANYLEISTDRLSDAATVAAIARFIDPEWSHVVQPRHLNASRIFDLTAIDDPYDRIRVERTLRDFDLHAAVRSDAYALEYFYAALNQDAIGRLHAARDGAGKIRQITAQLESWLATARSGRVPKIMRIGANDRVRRIKLPLPPEQQIKLEAILGSFDLSMLAADDTYGVLYFLEKLLAPLQDKDELAPSIVEILEPMYEAFQAQVAVDNRSELTAA